MASSTKARGRRSDRSGAKDDAGKASQVLHNWRSWLLGLLLTAAVVVAVLHWGDVKKFAELVAHARPLWLLAALGAQVLTYVALAVEWRLVLHAGHCRAPYRQLLGLTVAKHFADQMVPTAGMSGNVVVVDRLTAIGASRPVALAALIMTIIAYYAAYGVVALAALVMLWLRGHVSWPIVALIGACLALSVAVPALSLWLTKKGAKAIPAWLRRFRPVCELFEMIREAPDRLVRDRTLEGKLTLLNGAVYALDGWTCSCACSRSA